MLSMGDLGNSDCVFCAILRGEAESSVPYADDRAMVIMDTGAVTPGHLLVIPRIHAVGLEDLDEETSAHVWRVGHRMGKLCGALVCAVKA
ncbi:HIT domain-containing protein [Nonomuraea sp. NPDC046570]|uniref:HIT family protein n=1 Tax=Nonomuraea sp. NPDC046570 TaxID=3155255 RepID=UPI0033DD6986